MEVHYHATSTNGWSLRDKVLGSVKGPVFYFMNPLSESTCRPCIIPGLYVDMTAVAFGQPYCHYDALHSSTDAWAPWILEVCAPHKARQSRRLSLA